MGVGGSLFATKSEGVGLIVCTISFQDFEGAFGRRFF